MLKKTFAGLAIAGILAGSLYAFPRRVLLEEFMTEW
mgnify:CR=1 FL=1